MYAISIHPSGKLALSAGKDKTLRTWNLMTAKAAYITNIKQSKRLDVNYMHNAQLLTD